MNTKRIYSTIAVALACAPVMAGKAQTSDIVDTAVSAGQFTTLVSLVQKANLVETLKGEGPFTVLAPTDKAFAKLPKKLVEQVTNDTELLTKVLTYHVIAGKVLSGDLKEGKTVTVQGEKVKVKLSGKNVFFNDAKVLTANVNASNGVIHVIDTVILPPSLTKSKAH